MTKDELFKKLDSELLNAKTNKRKYYGVFEQALPCPLWEFLDYYSDYLIEVQVCRQCNPPLYTFIFTL